MLGQRFVVRFTTMYRSKSLNAVQHSFFACIAYGTKQCVQSNVTTSKKIFRKLYPNENIRKFNGVPFKKRILKQIAKLLKISLAVYTLRDAQGVRKQLSFTYTQPSSNHSINLVYFNRYYSFITDPKKFIGIFHCSECDRGFLTSGTSHDHRQKFHSATVVGIIIFQT